VASLESIARVDAAVTEMARSSTQSRFNARPRLPAISPLAIALESDL
jgi:hypothetical protein